MASGVRANPTSTNEDCPACELCGSIEELKVCARCKETWYCSKEHQKRHWKQHKKRCCVVQRAEVEGDPEGRVFSEVGGGLNGAHSQISVSECDSARTKPNISNGSERLEAIEGSTTSHEMSGLGIEESVRNLQLDPGCEAVNDKSNVNTPKEHVPSDIRPKQSNAKTKGNNKPSKKRCGRRQQPTMTEQKAVGSTEENKTKSLGDYVVKCLNDYGLCVVDNFLGEEICGKILDEVKAMQDKGLMCDGELVSKQTTVKKVRGDKIAWTEKGDPGREYLSVLVQKLDNLIMSCSQRFGRCVIGGRTKAMAACYPGNGAYYMRHVDNPHEDGRCITSIYYFNKDWDVSKDGGLLRIYPQQLKQVADIEPKFDRMLFFWSDRRNPHEVQPAHKTRYAVTVWYFDKEERKRAKLQQQQQADGYYIESANNSYLTNRIT